jgi:hypothetical protein
MAMALVWAKNPSGTKPAPALCHDSAASVDRHGRLPPAQRISGVVWSSAYGAMNSPESKIPLVAEENELPPFVDLMMLILVVAAYITFVLRGSMKK